MREIDNKVDDMNSNLVDMVSSFISCSSELRSREIPNLGIKIVHNIFDEVKKDDYQYAREREKILQKAYGLFYVNSNNEIEILVKEDNEINMEGTLYHEVVHSIDYYNLGRIKNISNIRELAEDVYFLMWAEFHATYLQYCYLLFIGGDNINVSRVVNEISDGISMYLSSNNKLDLSTTVDFFVRKYGIYIALLQIFPNQIKGYPNNFFLNDNFNRIYKFLDENRNLENIINKYDEFKNLLLSLQSEN